MPLRRKLTNFRKLYQLSHKSSDLSGLLPTADCRPAAPYCIHSSPKTDKTWENEREGDVGGGGHDFGARLSSAASQWWIRFGLRQHRWVSMETVGRRTAGWRSDVYALRKRGVWESEDAAERKKGKTNGRRNRGREWDETLALRDQISREKTFRGTWINGGHQRRISHNYLRKHNLRTWEGNNGLSARRKVWLLRRPRGPNPSPTNTCPRQHHIKEQPRSWWCHLKWPGLRTTRNEHYNDLSLKTKTADVQESPALWKSLEANYQPFSVPY